MKTLFRIPFENSWALAFVHASMWIACVFLLDPSWEAPSWRRLLVAACLLATLVSGLVGGARMAGNAILEALEKEGEE